MTTVILFTAIAAFCLAVNALTGNKDRPGRLLLWLLMSCLIFFAVLTPLQLIFHPQTWVLWVSAIALGLVVPTPKWVKR